MKTSIVQFGTSRFLQAHVDLFLSQGSDAKATVVETTGSQASQKRIKAFNDAQTFPVIIRGLENAKEVDRIERVSSVVRGLSARQQMDELVRIFCEEAEYVISNTGDNGYNIPNPSSLVDDDWKSYPELLCQLLHQRFLVNKEPVTIMPCELISRNGTVLKNIILDLIDRHGLSDEFREWVNQECIWINSLVDRIVSEPIDPIGAIAEPYALWAIEDQSGFKVPVQHDQVEVVDDLSMVERKKLHLLNLGHTLLAHRWLTEKRQPTETVCQIMHDREIFNWLSNIMESEIIPSFSVLEEEARIYWQSCVERFKNPFLDHKLSDIAQNHFAKINRRAGDLIAWKCQSDFPLLNNTFSHLALKDNA